jgi:hypothetical protein
MTLILQGTDNSVSSPAVQGGTAGATTGVYYPASNQLGLATNGTLALFVDGSQQVGIGATPVTWGQSKVIQIGAAGAFSSQTSSKTAEMTANGYLNSGWKYLTSGDKATLYYQYAGAHTFNATTATGSAGNAITWDAGTVLNPYGIGVGGAIPSSGIGITFPATQSASSDANTLDDYEEGTWTPTLTGGSSNPTGVSYGTQVGKYTKIGNVVNIFVYITWSTYTGGSGAIQISGLPFTSIGAVNGGYNNGSTQMSNVGMNAGYTWASVRTAPSQTLVDLQQQGSSNSWTTISFSNITSSATVKELLATVTYFTST